MIEARVRSDELLELFKFSEAIAIDGIVYVIRRALTDTEGFLTVEFAAVHIIESKLSTATQLINARADIVSTGYSQEYISSLVEFARAVPADEVPKSIQRALTSLPLS